MKKLLIMICLPWLAVAQEAGYWQQQVDYRMDIEFDSEKHQFSGNQEITYYNNSPDTLRRVYYHLYFNAFQPGSMMDERSRSIVDPDKRIRDRIAYLKPDEQGYHRVKRLTQNDLELVFRIEQTVLVAHLAEPLLPGDTAVFKMTFQSQVPVQIRRSGRNNSEGIDYTMTQWYPKMAAYDRDGWHPDFYVSREFYGDFGNYEVNINIAADYILAGTGVLANESEIWQEGKEIKGNQYWEIKSMEAERRTWNFKAERVHDFAWAADTDYLRIRKKAGDLPELNYYFLKKYRKNWGELTGYTADFFRLMSKKYGRYPYPQFSVIQGGDGGMEYPMCTMVKGTGKINGMVGLMVHESAHSWYYGVLASNESRYPWMDEGFTSFAEDEILKMMRKDSVVNPHLRAYANYLFMVEKDQLEPLSTPADLYSTNRNYAISAYSRGTLFLNQLRYIVGEKAFNQGMLAYFEEWQFKHPDPWDFMKVMERVSGLELDWYLEYWVYTTKTIDYAVKGVMTEGPNTAAIQLEKIGEMAMPLWVRVDLSNGTSVNYYVPVAAMFGTPAQENFNYAPAWPWTHHTYELIIRFPADQVEAVHIDPYRFMCDVKPANNSWPAEED